MAFCNKCGAQLSLGTRFCNNCGAPILASTLPPATSAAPPAPPATSAAAPASGGGALKIVLIVVGVIVLLGILGIASAGFFAWHVAHRARVRHEGDNVTVETPFGSVRTTKDPDEAARNLGVDLYPGAEVLKNGSASATFGNLHTAAINAESADSVDKVAGFYKSKFPNAMVTTSDSGRCTIVSNDHNNMITINIEAAGDKTKIHITNVHKASSDSSPSN